MLSGLWIEGHGDFYWKARLGIDGIFKVIGSDDEPFGISGSGKHWAKPIGSASNVLITAELLDSASSTAALSVRATA